MRKIPTLFQRDFAMDPPGRFVTMHPSDGCNWVLAGEGVATRKWDGTCVMFDGDRWWARREVKSDKTVPDGFVELEHDTVTGKIVGWMPAEQSSFASQLHEVVMRDLYGGSPNRGTFELIGPSINGNPDGIIGGNALVPHGTIINDVPDRSYLGLVEWFRDDGAQRARRGVPPIEGLVFYRTAHDPNSGMVKIKRKDFRELAD